MPNHLWLLVEWLDDQDDLPDYGIVSVNLLVTAMSDLGTGKEIYTIDDHERPRRARIIRISGRKRFLKEHKDILELQNEKVSKVFRLCMRSLSEVKPDRKLLKTMSALNGNSGVGPNIPLVAVNDHSSSSSSDHLGGVNVIRTPVFKINDERCLSSCRKRAKPTSPQGDAPRDFERGPVLISSTPAPGPSGMQKPATAEKETQTDFPSFVRVNKRLDDIEGYVKMLKDTADSILGEAFGGQLPPLDLLQINTEDNEPLVTQSGIAASDNSNDSAKSKESSDSIQSQGGQEYSLESIAIPQSASSLESGPAENTDRNSVDCVQNASTNRPGSEIPNTLAINKKQDDNLPGPSGIQKNPPQTSDTAPNRVNISDGDMVRLGPHTVVSARVYNEINWNVYTSATRQLLQDLFPRWILATHSLTGRPSPAFASKAPKKILNPKIVEDIVRIVSVKSNVPTSLVRCSACDSLFPSLMALEHHKEEFQHWSDSSYCSHTDSDDSDLDTCHEDRHRLL